MIKPDMTHNEAGHAGAFDGLTDDTLRGWIVELPVRGGNPVAVAFFLEGMQIGTCVADLPREDLAVNAGITVPCGFELPVVLLDRSGLAAATPDTPITVGIEGSKEGHRLQGAHITAGDVLHRLSQNCEMLERVHRTIASSGLFDSTYYASQAGLRTSSDRLLNHYIGVGEKHGLRPSARFDSVFYLRLNPDLKKVENLLSHYIEYGSHEGRYPTLEILRADAAEVEAADLFDTELFYVQNRGRLIQGLTPAEQHLGGLWRLGSRASENFDDLFYSRTYRNLEGLAPLIHYCRIGRSEGRYTNGAAFGGDRAVIAPHFDYGHYVSANPGIGEDGDLLDHYLTIGQREGYSPRADFDPQFYRASYHDISTGGIEPFGHFIKHGKDEGRNATFRLSAWLHPGKRRYDPDLLTYIVVSHEASRTGAPLVALEVCKQLSRVANVIAISGKKGPLIESFAEVGIAVLAGAADQIAVRYMLREVIGRWGVTAAVLNSAESMPWSIACLAMGVPSVALVHEFAEYSLPPGKIATIVANSDRVIVPADIIRRSLAKELMTHRNGEPNSVVVAHQGHLPSLPVDKEANDLDWPDLQAFMKIDPARKVSIVLGAGAVQPRKGTDYFIQIAAAVRDRMDDVHFLWVGEGYHPDTDLGYGIWLREQIARQGVGDIVHFLPAQSSLDSLFEHSDLFLLSSRLDPFPNVAIDAMAAGRKVVCFAEATGIAELIMSGRADGAVTPYADVEAAATVIAELLRAGSTSPRNRELIERDFDFAAYTRRIVQEIDKAIDARRRIDDHASIIAAGSLFDDRFHSGRALDRKGRLAALIDYATLGVKGLSRFSPRPGFNEGLYWAQYKDAVRDQPALAHAIAAGEGNPVTHRCILIGQQGARAASAGDGKTLRKALHVHLHYPDLAPNIMARLKRIEEPMDLFVTTTTDRKAMELRYLIGDLGLAPVEIVVGPNRGRDMGPFVALLPKILAEGYDLVGHVHGKKSHAVNPTTGDGWREYLLDHMLGDVASMATIEAAFFASPRLGLVFPEDRHVVGWSDNLAVARSLAGRISPSLTLPTFPYFPLGAMFWARPASLASLTALPVADLAPPEPLPHDGTVLHAIERMLPAVAEDAGFEWATVYRPGRAWG